MYSPSSDTRFSEAQKLLNYGFSNFTNISFGDKGDIVGTVQIEKGVSTQINAVLEENASLFIQKSKSSQIIQNVNLADTIEAPIEKGEVIGTISYTLDNEIIKTINIVASDTVRKLNLINMTTSLYETWFNLLR